MLIAVANPATAHAQQSGQSGRLEGNGMVLEWSISGADVGDMTYAERTWQASGTITSSTVRISGTMSAAVTPGAYTESGMQVYIVITGGAPQEVKWNGELSDANGLSHEMPFNLSIEVPAGAGVQMAASVNMVGGVADLLAISVGLPPATTTTTPAVTVTTEPTSSPSTTTAPRADRSLRLTGVVYDITGSSMPYIRMCITPSYGSRMLLQTNQNGGYDCTVPLPANQTKPFDVKIEVALRCWLQSAVEFRNKSDRTAFNLTDSVDSSASKDIVTATTIHIDPSSPEYAGVTIISVSRALNFQTIPHGYFSADNNGKPEAFSSNITAVWNLPAYSYLYHELINGLMFGVVQLGERKSMLSKMPLKVVLNFPPATEVSHFMPSENTIYLNPEKCTFTDDARFTVLHEFGHFVEWATNNGASRCKRDQRVTTGTPPDKNHGGYLNNFTADSFTEGFATWYAGAVQRFGLYVEPEPAEIGSQGSLNDSIKVWDRNGVGEEFAIAHILYKQLDFRTIKELWSVLKPDRDNFFDYYNALTAQTFLSGIGKYADVKKSIDKLFVDCDFFKMPFGNGQYDASEPYTDSNKNGNYDAGEPYCDLMYDFHAVPVQPMELLDESTLVIGKSEAFNMTRDVSTQPSTTDNGVEAGSAATTYCFPNSWLVLTGSPVQSVRIIVKPDGQEPWAYLAPVQDGRVYIGLPGRFATGTIEASVPGGGAIWSGDIAELIQQFNDTLGTDTPLARATIEAAHLAPEGTIACPVGGSVTASGVLEIKPVSNDEAAVVAENDSGAADPFAEDSAGQDDTTSPSSRTNTTWLLVVAGVVGLAVVVGLILILVLARGKRSPKPLPAGQAAPQLVPPPMQYPVPKGYSGQHINGVPHGSGKLVMDGGGIYEGQFRGGWFHGQGVMRWPGGQVYEGEWVNGAQHGFGKLTDATGRVQYQGQWANGKPL